MPIWLTLHLHRDQRTARPETCRRRRERGSTPPPALTPSQTMTRAAPAGKPAGAVPVSAVLPGRRSACRQVRRGAGVGPPGPGWEADALGVRVGQGTAERASVHAKIA
jgi:hypothetical protein